MFGSWYFLQLPMITIYVPMTTQNYPKSTLTAKQKIQKVVHKIFTGRSVAFRQSPVDWQKCGHCAATLARKSHASEMFGLATAVRWSSVKMGRGARGWNEPNSSCGIK
jgi:hypothetical protein